jgi:zinc protease
MQVVQETTQALLKEITQAELDDHKANILGGFALQIDSNKDMVGYLAMMAFYGLPEDWIHIFPEQIKALSRAEVQEVAQKYLKPELWTGVVLGNLSEQNTATEAVALPKPEQTAHH